MKKGTKVFVEGLNKIAVVKEWNDKIDVEYGTIECICYVVANGETYKVYKEDCTECKYIKFTSKISYEVNKDFDYDFNSGEYKDTLSSREAYVDVKGKSIEDVEAVLYNFINLAEEQGYTGGGCWQVEEFEGIYYASESFIVEDREEYNDFKAMYKSWKKNAKDNGIY